YGRLGEQHTVGGGNEFAKLGDGGALAVRKRVALNPPALGKRAEVHHVIAQRVEECGGGGLRVRVVACDGQRASISGARGQAVGGDLFGVDVVERLDDVGLRQVRLEQLGGSDLAPIDGGDGAVTVGVIVVRVEYDFAD